MTANVRRICVDHETAQRQPEPGRSRAGRRGARVLAFRPAGGGANTHFGPIRPYGMQGATAHIHRPGRSASRAGRGNGRYWILEFEPREPPVIEPLMGWTGSGDTLRQVRLRFPSKQSAIAFAERRGWPFTVHEPRKRLARKQFDRVIPVPADPASLGRVAA